MSSIDGAGASRADFEVSRLDVPKIGSAASRCVVRLPAVFLGAALLAACAQSSVVSRNSAFIPTHRQASLERDRMPSPVPERGVAAAHASHDKATATRSASQGLASFYSEGSRTASGEKFDANELTAAHPTLPFGTRLRVTNVATGKSVTVRVNDRGPYVPGRVVDVSYSAARVLGMVGGGVAKVKLDVVQ
jgi:peptidoglycan lytic transglycosylase